MEIYYSRFAKMRRKQPAIDQFAVATSLHPDTFHNEKASQKVFRFFWSRVLPVTLLLFLFTLIKPSSAYAQNVTLKKNKVSLESILKDIESQTSYVFFYKKEEIEPIKNVSIDIADASMFETLTTLLKGLDIEYELFEKTIGLKKVVKPVAAPIDKRKTKTINRIIGQVVDENELPLKGIALRETKINTSAISDNDGRFALVVGASGSIEASGGGFARQIVNYKDTTALYIVMEKGKTASIELGEVAINYNSVKKNPTTMVNLENRNYMNLSQVLQGTIPGLTLQTVNTTSVKITSIDDFQQYSSGGGQLMKWVRMSVEDYLAFYGQKKGQATIDKLLKGEGVSGVKLNTVSTVNNVLVPQIRGANNFSASASSMLVVIDGFPQDGFPSNYPMTNVESIEVIKDPKELIKWGPKASGGAILIKTKAAKKGKINVDYNANFYYSAAQNFNRSKLNLASPSQYLSYMKQIDSIFPTNYTASTFNLSPAKSLLVQKRLGTLTTQQFNSKWDSIGRLDNEAQLNMLQQDRFSQNHALTVSGGNNVYKFTGIGNFTDDQSNELYSNTKSYGLSLNNDFSLLKNKLHIKWLINFSNDNAKTAINSFSPSNTTLEPYQMLLDANGNYVYDYTTISTAANRTIMGYGYKDFGVNVLQDARLNKNSNSITQKKSNMNLKWDLLPGLIFSSSFYYVGKNTGQKTFYDKQSSYVRQLVDTYGEFNNGNVNFYVPYGDILSQNSTRYNEYNVRTNIGYTKAIGKHEIGIGVGVGGASIESSRPAAATLYGYNSNTQTATPVYLPTPSPTAPITNFYSLFSGSVSSVTPYSITRPINGDTTISRNLNGNATLNYSYAERLKVSGSYNAVLNPLYGQAGSFSKLTTLNGDVTGTVIKNWGKVVHSVDLSVGITKLKMPDLAVQYNNRRYQQTYYNNYAIWVTGQEPTQQKGQTATNYYQRVTVSLLDSTITVNAAFNQQKSVGSLESVVSSTATSASATETKSNYLSAGIVMSLRKNNLNMNFDYSRSPEGSTQYNGAMTYNIAKENYFYSNTINSLDVGMKLQNISPYQGLNLIMNTNVATNGSFSQAVNSDFSVVPPRNISYEAYARMAMLDDKYSFDLRYYNQSSAGINSTLSTVADPSTGVVSKVSYSDITNKGIEFFLSGNFLKTSDFSYTLTLNGAYNVNVATSVPLTGFTASDGYTRAYRDGYSTSNLWTLPWAGLNSNGDPQYYDSKGNVSTKLDSASVASSLVYAGVTKAPWTGGVIQDVRFKNFFARAAIVFNLGYVMRYYIPYASNNLETSALIANRWQKPGDEANTDVARLTADGSNGYRQFVAQYSSNSIISADNIRLSELMIGCYLPQKFLQKIKLSAATISFQVQNVAGWYRNKYNIDPYTISSIGRPGLSAARIYSANVNVSF